MNLPPDTRFRLLPTLLIVAVAWLVLAWPWLSGSVTVPWDSKAHFQPQLSFLAQSIHSGESPFWAPFVFGGHPQVADPQSLIFSPPFLLMAFLNPSPGLRSLDAAVFLALLAGAFAVVIYFRDRRWREAGAVVAAISFAFGGAAAWRIQHVGQVVSVAWLPVALLLLDRALRRGSAAYGLAAGAAAGLMLLGRDQVAFLGIVTLVAYALMVIVRVRPLMKLKGLVAPLAAGAVGGLVTVAVPLVMTLLVAADSNRPDITLIEAGKGSLHPWSLLTAVIPHMFGIARPLTDYWGPPSPDWGPVDIYLARNMATFYFGMIPMFALALFPVLWRFRARFAGASQPAGADADPHRADALFLFAAFLVLMLYSLGRYTPVFGFIFHVLPGVDRFRRPADALFIACAFGSMAAGYAVHRWVSEPTFRLTPMARIVALAIGGAIAAAALFIAQQKGKLPQIAFPGVAAACFAGAAVLAMVLLKRLARRELLAATVAAIAVSADLGWNNYPNESTGLSPETYDVLRPDTSNATIAMLKDLTAKSRAPDRIDRIELAGVDFHWPNATLTHGLHHTLGYNPVRSALLSRGFGARDHIAGPDQRAFTPLAPSYRSLIVDMMGLRYIATRIPLEELHKVATAASQRPPTPFPLEDFPLVGRTQDAFVYENPRAFPRVMFVRSARQADFNAIIETGAWPEGFEPRDTVLIGRPVSPEEAKPRAPGGSVRIVSYRNTEVILEASSPEGGYVVLNDSWQDWWRADIDGRPVALEQANVMFRAVAVPAGTVRVRFSFHPFLGALGEVLQRK